MNFFRRQYRRLNSRCHPGLLIGVGRRGILLDALHGERRFPILLKFRVSEATRLSRVRRRRLGGQLGWPDWPRPVLRLHRGPQQGTARKTQQPV